MLSQTYVDDFLKCEIDDQHPTAVADLSPFVAGEGLLEVTREQTVHLRPGTYLVAGDGLLEVPREPTVHLRPRTCLVTGDGLLEVPREGTIHLWPRTYLDFVRGGGDLFHFADAIEVIEQIEDIGWESEMELHIKQLKLETAKISADHQSIMEGYMHLTEKFKEIEFECVQLREESKLISQQRAETNARLMLLSKILQAREDKDFVKATNLTVSLRELIATQNEK